MSRSHTYPEHRGNPPQGDSLPEWLKTAITLERMIGDMKALKGEELTRADAKACAYLMTLSLTQRRVAVILFSNQSFTKRCFIHKVTFWLLVTSKYLESLKHS